MNESDQTAAGFSQASNTIGTSAYRPRIIENCVLIVSVDDLPREGRQTRGCGFEERLNEGLKDSEYSRRIPPRF